VVGPVGWAARALTIGEEDLTQGSVLAQRLGFRCAGLDSEQATVGAIHVTATDRENSARHAAEAGDSCPGVALSDRKHVQHHIRCRITETRGKLPERYGGARAVNVPHAEGKVRLVEAPMEDRDLMPLVVQAPHDMGTDEVGSSKNQNPHLTSGYRPSLRETPADR
jgi:hypothetical protein